MDALFQPVAIENRFVFLLCIYAYPKIFPRIIVIRIISSDLPGKDQKALPLFQEKFPVLGLESSLSSNYKVK